MQWCLLAMPARVVASAAHVAFVAAIVMLTVVVVAPKADALSWTEDLSGGETSANEGYLTIAWQEGAPPFELRQVAGTSTGEPIALYQGEDRSFFMTGLTEGQNRFVVEDDEGASLELTVSVDYPQTWAVILSLCTGIVLLIALVTIVIQGSRAHV